MELTHLDKVYWPARTSGGSHHAAITKGDLVDHYKKIAPVIVPHLKARPENLNRHPDGIKGAHFFQKETHDLHVPEFARKASIFSKTDGHYIDYLVCENSQTLLYMVNLGCIEINPWNSRVGSLEMPDWIVLDIDPDGNPMKEIAEVAQTVRHFFDAEEHESFCKTSGKRGLHVFVPLKHGGRGQSMTYEAARDIAHQVAKRVHERLPQTTSLERHPDKRRGKIYLDYLQNGFGQTLCAPYSVRPTPEATVSTPLKWNEVNADLDPRTFTMKTIFERLKRLGDLWPKV